MNKILHRVLAAMAASAALMLASGPAHAQLIITDTLTGLHSLYNWKALNGACLTAGDNSITPSDGTQYTPAAPGALTIPACKGLGYYSGTTLVGGATGTGVDVSGSGALRLTNGDYQQGSNGDSKTGAVISNFTFPSTSGVQVTWTSVTYGGDNDNNTGADGISFFLSDGALSPTIAGGLGGSLGYSCSNTNAVYEGLLGGYLGVGIDEFGNFTNGSTYTVKNGVYSYASNDNTASGSGYHPGQIGVRGAGDITWSELSRLYPTYYPVTATLTQQKNAVVQTCITGHKYNTLAGTANTSAATAISDYNYLTSSVLPTSVKLANQEAPSTSSSSKPNVSTRGAAIPVSYTLRITSAGILDFSYSVNGGATTAVLSAYDIQAVNGKMPANLRFGFSGGTGGGSNVHEITCFKAAPADTTNSSAGSNVQSAQVTTDSQVFTAYYHPVNWWGSLTASNLVYTAATSTTSDSLGTATANWDASCVLTGGACTTVNGSPTLTAQASRVVLSNNGGASGGTGVAFTAAGLTSTQVAALGDSASNAPEIAYLRGDRSNEVGSGTGTYRIRTSVLGDIVDSSPVLVSYPSSAYTGPWADKLNAAAAAPEGTSYAAFKTQWATRPNVVYVGANDGMLHGFAAGSFAAPVGTSAPVFNTGSNTGTEVVAYVPAQVVNTIASPTVSLDFSDPGYVHNFFVDATPGTGDLYYNGQWHTWVVGGVGPGAHAGGAIANNATVIPQPVSSLFALDVTNPSSLTEANASSVVVGDWTSSTVTCSTTLYNSVANCGIYLGQTLGTPYIRRLHDGSWAVIFGNGTNSYGGGSSSSTPTMGHSGLFIMHVDSSGAETFQYIDANVGPAGGIVQVAPVDLDGDHITDYVYGGDVLGNLYRFDLTSSSPTAWTSMKIFSAGSTRPITTTPVITSIPGIGTSGPKLLVAFGTGQKLPVTVSAAEVYSTGSQALYGIWDANMTAWNATTTDTKYAALGVAGTPVAITSSQLQPQTITTTSLGRVVSNLAVCWSGITTCDASSTVTNAMGWTLVLPTSTEQVIYNPTVNGSGDFYVNTTIPATAQILTCSSTSVASWTMGISVTNGGAGSTTAFTGGLSGVSLNGAGTVGFYTVGTSTTGTSSTSTFLGTNTNDEHQFKTVKLNPQPGIGTRVTWTKIR